MVQIMKSWALFAGLASATAVATTDYEYVVVGSGAGGGPLAARLALAGHKTLLIDAGVDRGDSVNYTVPAYQAKSTEDHTMDWDFFVQHYQDTTRQKKDYKLTYDLPGGGIYIGQHPPAGATIKGILYPRSATLGGCTAHNALVTIYPDENDFTYLANLTGDSSWNHENMRKYWVKLENAIYAKPNQTGHGYDGWLGVDEAPVQLALNDPQLYNMVAGAAQALGNGTRTTQNYVNILQGDANADNSTRDTTEGLYQIPIASRNGIRNGARDFILSVVNAKNADGSQKYPLDLQLNTFVTNVTFDQSVSPPKANGVNYLVGTALYRADPRSKTAAPGVPGSVKASREVIVAGGSFNSPQILKLSGIGPAAELKKFGIKVIADLPGVGANLQDHYEISVQGYTAKNFSVLDNCNFGYGAGGAESDPCYNTWAAGTNGTDRGSYVSSGFAAAMFQKTSTAPMNDYDLFEFGGPNNFRGYFPGYAYNATMYHNWWTWAILKSHPRNTAGTVKLRSANPLDTPLIQFNYFDAGSGDYNADLEAIYEGIQNVRQAFNKSGVAFTEVLPGASVQSPQDIKEFVKNTAWGHHCSSTCAIGPDGDKNAVLDSSFRVRKVQGLRVVDASVYPKIPGTFTAASTYLVGEKAADVILSQLA